MPLHLQAIPIKCIQLYLLESKEVLIVPTKKTQNNTLRESKPQECNVVAAMQLHDNRPQNHEISGIN